MAGRLTKCALERSLKHLLLKKPLSRITIADIAEDCGISRMTFYYHFKDIYDLVEWACERDADRALAGYKTADTWQLGLLNIFRAVLENKPFILNVYRSVSPERIHLFLLSATRELIAGVVAEHMDGRHVGERDRAFIADFLAHAFIGIMLGWIRDDMREDPGQIVRRIVTISEGAIDTALSRFESAASAGWGADGSTNGNSRSVQFLAIDQNPDRRA